jgi:hypothetical protein
VVYRPWAAQRRHRHSYLEQLRNPAERVHLKAGSGASFPLVSINGRLTAELCRMGLSTYAARALRGEAQPASPRLGGPSRKPRHGGTRSPAETWGYRAGPSSLFVARWLHLRPGYGEGCPAGCSLVGGSS